MKKFIPFTLFALVISLLVPNLASAHVVISPGSAKVGERALFTVSVPNERDTDVNNIKVSIPSGLSDVQPTVHAGWRITTEQDDKKNITSIIWSQGDIPAGQRDDFTFKAQLPAKATSLTWKAYQTYSDGTLVSWDQPANAEGHDEENSTKGPASVTKVVDDLNTAEVANTSPSTASRMALVFSLAAVIVSLYALIKKPRV